MPNIRKLLTHKWFTHEENETKWRHKFLPRQWGMYAIPSNSTPPDSEFYVLHVCV
jgi:hypothetical protein